VGLGLAIVKSIVAAHDGTVSITSTRGVGSTVRVQLPLEKSVENQAIVDNPITKRQL
jgi:signal transduction histidine kinase